MLFSILVCLSPTEILQEGLFTVLEKVASLRRVLNGHKWLLFTPTITTRYIVPITHLEEAREVVQISTKSFTGHSVVPRCRIHGYLKQNLYKALLKPHILLHCSRRTIPFTFPDSCPKFITNKSSCEQNNWTYCLFLILPTVLLTQSQKCFFDIKDLIRFCRTVCSFSNIVWCGVHEPIFHTRPKRQRA